MPAPSTSRSPAAACGRGALRGAIGLVALAKVWVALLLLRSGSDDGGLATASTVVLVAFAALAVAVVGLLAARAALGRRDRRAAAA